MPVSAIFENLAAGAARRDADTEEEE